MSPPIVIERLVLLYCANCIRNRRIPDHCRRADQIVVKCRSIQQWLDSAARLTKTGGDIDLAVDLLVLVIDAADHRQNFCRTRPEGNERAIVHVVAGFQRSDPFGDDPLGRLLQSQIQSCIDVQPAPPNETFAQRLIQFLDHVVDKMRCAW